MRIKWLNNLKLLSDILSHFNYSRDKNNNIEICRHFFDGLNLIYNEYYYQKYLKNKNNIKVYENQKLSELVIDNINDNEKELIVESKQFKKFLNIEPSIMNMRVLIKAKYHPENISPSLKEMARREHKKLRDVFNKFITDASLINDLLKNLCESLYVVRSNMDHGEKTPFGPDLNKFERDLTVCNSTLPLLKFLTDILLDYPNKKIAFYDTLKPGGINDILLKDLQINLYKASVRGNIYTKNNYLFFDWKINNSRNEVFVYEPLPEDKIKEIDEFEGKLYKRILVPIETETDFKISNIYVENKRYKLFQ